MKGEDMKRYKWTHLFSISSKAFSGPVGYIKEDSEGEWVKWEDVKGILQHMKGYRLEPEGLKCNCFEKAFIDDPKVMPADIWICPAHGYKRR